MIKLLQIFTLLIFSLSLQANVLHRGNGTEPETLDIHKSSGVPEANIQRDLFEGLVAEAADGSTIPGVAEQWKLSEDKVTWTFTLRQDAKWSDGSPVTANDFVYAWRRAVNPQTASDYAFILWAIKNAEAISKGEIKDVTQLGVKAINEHVLEVTLQQPTPYFIDLLTHHMAYPLHAESIEKYGSKWTRAGNMVSNGAYSLTEWMPQSHLKLSKNAEYHDAENTQLETVIYYPTEDQSTELKRFRAGELDITADIPTDQVSWVEENLQEAFHNSPYIGTYYYALNLDKPPFKDKPELRKALALALDRDILTQKITKAGEIPAWSWVPEGVNGYQQQLLAEKSLEKKARETFAQKLYTEAGFSKENPLEIELLYNTSDNHKKIAVAVSAMWKKVLGVKTTLRNEEWKVYLDSRNRRDFQVIRAGWIGDYNDAYTFLSLFKSDVGTMNPSLYVNAKYDDLIKQAEKEVDSNKRMNLMQQAEQQLMLDMPIIPVYHYTTQHLVNPAIKGWKDNVMDVHPSRFLSKAP